MDDQSPLSNRLLGKAKSLTAEITAQLLVLATSALGLVAALSWNDAVQAVFKEYYPATRGIAPKFVYAILVSLLIIITTINLTRLANYAKNGTKK
jgi:ABC-type Mn2+/Zn2+ transport system permease subunit